MSESVLKILLVLGHAATITLLLIPLLWFTGGFNGIQRTESSTIQQQPSYKETRADSLADPITSQIQ